MLIYPVSNMPSTVTYNRNSFPSISFSSIKSDVFVKSEKTGPNNVDKEKLLNILNGDSRKLTKDFFEQLSPEEYQFCLEWAKSDEKLFSGMVLFSPKSVLPEDVLELAKYTDFYYRGLQKIVKKENKDMKELLLVGIGQSPVTTIKAIELTGVKTACCPISGLTRFKEPIDKYVTEENVEKYFSYWKEFGFNLDDLFSDKLIIFTDHKETGKTFQLFKKIINAIIKIKSKEMKKLGKKPTTIKFLSLREIYRQAPKDKNEILFGDNFEDEVFNTSYLKTLYSPLFKLPLNRIHEIKDLHKQASSSDKKIRFNKFTVLLYNAIYHLIDKPDKKSEKRISDERQFRLSFYTPKDIPDCNNSFLHYDDNVECFYPGVNHD